MVITKNDKNTNFLDLLRIICCFCIIVLHVNHTSVVDFDGSVPSDIYEFVLNMKYSLQFAVPVFLMMTGYIYLGHKTNVTYSSIKKHIIKFLLIIVFINTFFNILELYYYERVLTFDLIKRSIVLMINGKSFDHMWYIWTIFSIYLIIPLLNKFFISNTKDVSIFMAISFMMIFIIPVFNKYSSIQVYTEFPFSWVLFYVFLGGYIYSFSIINKTILNVLLALLLAVCFIVNLYVKNKTGTYLTNGNGTLLSCIEAFLAFNLIRNIYKDNNTFVKTVSRQTLNIYIFHVVFVHLMTKILNINPIKYGGIIGLFFACIIIFIVSTLFSFILNLVVQAMHKGMEKICR